MNFSVRDIGACAYRKARDVSHRIAPNFHPIGRIPGSDRFQRSLGVEQHEVEGHRMNLADRDYISHRLRERKGWEPATTRLMQLYATSGSVAVDAGAHIGYFTLVLAQAVGPKGTVHAFEPQIENYDLLTHNVRLNGYTNIKTSQMAVGHECGYAQLYISDIDRGDHSLYAANENRQSTRVPMVRLDEYLNGSGEGLSVIKLDIQGGEIDALAGASRLIDPCCRGVSPNLKIIAEYEPVSFIRSARSPADMICPLLKRGYHLHEVDEIEECVYPTTIEELAAKYPDRKPNGHLNDEGTNLFFSREPVSFSLK